MGIQHPKEWELRDDIIKLHKSGITIPSILEKLNQVYDPPLTIGGLKRRIHTMRKSNLLPLRQRPHDENSIDRALELYAGGKTIPAISQETGIPESTLTRHIMQTGMANRRSVTPEEMERQVIEMCRAGKSNKDIIEATGLKDSTIRAIRRRHRERTGEWFDQRKWATQEHPVN